MESLNAVVKVLHHRRRHDLAQLLARTVIDFDVSSSYGSLRFSLITTAEIYAPLSDYDRLKALSRDDQALVLEAVLEIWPPRDEEMEVTNVVYRLDPDSLKDAPGDSDEILKQLDRLRSIMIAVSTGGPKIDSINPYYKKGYRALAEGLEERGIQNPVPYTDLWDWYGKWSSGDLPTYQSRREYIRGLFGPIETRLREGPSVRGTEVFAEPTGWPRVDRTLGEARSRLETATNEEQFQSVGLLCREALISLGQTVFEPDLHPPLDDVSISKTDAKRMLDRYLAAEIAGKSNEVPRKHAKAALALANELTHKRTAVFRDAALCAEATASVINIIAILSGIRDPEQGAG